MSNYNAQLQSNNTSLRDLLQTVNKLSSGAGQAYSENEDALLNGTLSGIYTNSGAKKIGMYAFREYSLLTGVDFPSCESVGYAAFYAVSGLETASFPACSFIDEGAFYACSNLTTAYFPKCTSIQGSAFNKAINLRNTAFEACTSIGHYAFFWCSALASISLSQCETLENHAFYSCINLAKVSFPACKTTGSYAFGRCYALTKVSLPACVSLSSGTFNECQGLTAVDLPVCNFIGEMGIRYCPKLSDVRLGASTVCVLENSNAFSSTPFAGYSSAFSSIPHFYVPSSLITAYQSATNWVYYSSYFSSLENAPFTFTIKNKQYTGLPGMTWEEWINSEYNTHPALEIGANNWVVCPECGGDVYYSAEGWDEGEIKFRSVRKGETIEANKDYSHLCNCHTITFTIEGTEYQAQEGMTWGEWVDSRYNTDGYIIFEGHWITKDYSYDGKTGLGYANVVEEYGDTLGVYYNTAIKNGVSYYKNFIG